MQAIQIYIDHDGTGSKRSPPLNDIEDLSDTRILLRLINAIFPQTFTPEVLLNDRLADPGYWFGDFINSMLVLSYYWFKIYETL